MFEVAITLIISLLVFNSSAHPHVADMHASMNWKKAMENNRTALLVMFYAPWCEHCKQAKQEFAAAAEALKDKPDTKFGWMNCEVIQNARICNEHAPDGYPTIKLFKGDKVIEEYLDENKRENFIEYMSHPPMASEDGKQKMIVSEKAISRDDEMMPDVVYFIGKNFTHLKNYERAIVLFYVPWCPECKKTKPHYSRVASIINPESESKLILAGVNCEAHANKDFCKTVKIEMYPTVRYYMKGEFWDQLDGEITEKSLMTYVQNFPKEKKDLDKLLKDIREQDKKRQQEAERADWGAVIDMRSSEDFEKHIKTPDSIITFFYAPWCGFCKKFRPTFVEIANSLSKSIKNLGFIGVNCDDEAFKEICDRYVKEGYPSLAIFTEGRRQTEIRDRDDLEAEIKEYLKKRAATKKKASKSAKDEL